KALEQEYLKRSSQKPEFTKYKEVVEQMRDLYKSYHPVKYNVYNYLEFYRYSGPEIIRVSEHMIKMTNDTIDAKTLKSKYAEDLLKGMRGFYKDYDVEIDKQIF